MTITSEVGNEVVLLELCLTQGAIEVCIRLPLLFEVLHYQLQTNEGFLALVDDCLDFNDIEAVYCDLLLLLPSSPVPRPFDDRLALCLIPS